MCAKGQIDRLNRGVLDAIRVVVMWSECECTCIQPLQKKCRSNIAIDAGALYRLLSHNGPQADRVRQKIDSLVGYTKEMEGVEVTVTVTVTKLENRII